MIGLLISLAGILVGAYGGLVNASVEVVLGALVAVIGAVVQFRDSRPYVVILNSAEWTRTSSGEFQITIPRRVHRKVDPRIELLIRDGDRLSVCGADFDTLKDGTVVITAAQPIDGKLIVS